MEKFKVKGKRGSWFAEVDGESLPCVHMHWASGFPMKYDDPNFEESSKFIELATALKKIGKAILTDDKVLDGGKGFERTGYRHLWTVENVRVEGSHLRFDFKDKLGELFT